MLLISLWLGAGPAAAQAPVARVLANQDLLLQKGGETIACSPSRDGRGVTTSLRYDAVRRPTKIGDSTFEYGKDESSATGRLTAMTDESGKLRTNPEVQKAYLGT